MSVAELAIHVKTLQQQNDVAGGIILVAIVALAIWWLAEVCSQP